MADSFSIEQIHSAFNKSPASERFIFLPLLALNPYYLEKFFPDRFSFITGDSVTDYLGSSRFTRELTSFIKDLYSVNPRVFYEEESKFFEETTAATVLILTNKPIHYFSVFDALLKSTLELNNDNSSIHPIIKRNLNLLFYINLGQTPREVAEVEDYRLHSSRAISIIEFIRTVYRNLRDEYIKNRKEITIKEFGFYIEDENELIKVINENIKDPFVLADTFSWVKSPQGFRWWANKFLQSPMDFQYHFFKEIRDRLPKLSAAVSKKEEKPPLRTYTATSTSSNIYRGQWVVPEPPRAEIRRAFYDAVIEPRQ